LVRRSCRVGRGGRLERLDLSHRPGIRSDLVGLRCSDLERLGDRFRFGSCGDVRNDGRRRHWLFGPRGCRSRGLRRRIANSRELKDLTWVDEVRVFDDRGIQLDDSVEVTHDVSRRRFDASGGRQPIGGEVPEIVTAFDLDLGGRKETRRGNRARSLAVVRDLGVDREAKVLTGPYVARRSKRRIEVEDLARTCPVAEGHFRNPPERVIGVNDPSHPGTDRRFR
jgi:hypothetical protein